MELLNAIRKLTLSDVNLGLLHPLDYSGATAAVKCSAATMAKIIGNL